MNTNTIAFKRSPFALAISMLLGAPLSNQAFAEESKFEEKKNAAQTIMDVIQVRGTKSTAAEAAQTVPAQVVALGAAQLEARKVVNIEDLAFATPNVALDAVGTVPGVANFSIRGLGINSSIPSIDPHVGVFIDGVYTGVTYGVVTDTFDLESIEIFKGPQGVLFGRNVTGGAVLLRSARPDGEFKAKFKVGYEEEQTTLGAAIEGGLSDTVAGKISVYQKNDRGWFHNTTLDESVGADKTQTVRGTLVYQPNNSTDLTLIAEHGTIDGDGAVAQNPRLEGTAAGGGNADSFESIQNVKGETDVSWDQLTFEAGFDWGKGRVTNIMAIRSVDSWGRTDVDAADPSRYNAILHTDQSQFSNELRYNVGVKDDWDLTTGLFYFTQDFVYTGGREHGPVIRRVSGGHQDQSNLGVFINNEYYFSDSLTLNAGLRYTEESKDVEVYPVETIIEGTGQNCSFVEWTCSGAPTQSTSNDNFSPKLGFEWTDNESHEMLVYGSWSRGYRSPMYNFRSEVTPVATDLEKHDSLELGIKMTTEDGNFRVNAAVFHNAIKDLVRETIITNELGVRQDILNTADATIQGIEVDTMLLIGENLVLNAGVGLLDGSYDKIRDDVDLDSDGEFGDKDQLDLNIPRLSDVTYNLGVTYEMSISDYGSLAARADYNYRSEAANTDNNKGNFKSMKMINAGLTFTPNDGNWTLSIYGKNLDDTVHLGTISPLPWPDSQYFASMKKGRRFGVDFIYSF